MAFVCEFQHTPLQKNDFFSQCSTPLVGMRFWGHVSNSFRNKNMEKYILHLLLKWFFWPSKHCYPLRAQEEKTFMSTWNIMILQIARNECV